LIKPILIIEDDAAIRETFSEVLTMENYSVVEAENGQVGINELEEGFKPGLILLDLMMPVKDGFQFLEEVKTHPEWSKIPIVIISANGNLQQKIAQLDRPFPSMRKPIGIDSLLGTVQRYWVAPASA